MLNEFLNESNPKTVDREPLLKFYNQNMTVDYQSYLAPIRELEKQISGQKAKHIELTNKAVLYRNLVATPASCGAKSGR